LKIDNRNSILYRDNDGMSDAKGLIMLALTFLAGIALNVVLHLAIDPSLRNNLVQRYIKPAGFHVKLPEKSVIKNRLCAANFKDLVEKTSIDAKLENKEIYYRDVEAKVEGHLLWYNAGQGIHPQESIRAAAQNKQQIVEILLTDHPALIEQIRAEKAKSSEYLAAVMRQLST
jgi:hypothetical protein